VSQINLSISEGCATPAQSCHVVAGFDVAAPGSSLKASDVTHWTVAQYALEDNQTAYNVDMTPDEAKTAAASADQMARLILSRR
jgi:hypothetical protein